MSEKFGDPIGEAILRYAGNKKPADIIVISDICEDDIIPVEVLFRSYQEMPEIEKVAISLAIGKILDVGAGAGVHSLELMKRGLKVEAIDLSPGAVSHMKNQGIHARNVDFFDLNSETFDTIIMLMNGIGIAGKLSNLENTLSHAKSLLNKGGKIICDSSDINYLYEDDDGSMWVNLNAEYFGNFRFQMIFDKEKGPWFDWLYVDFDRLFQAAQNVGLKAKRVSEQYDHYLAELSL